MFKTSLLIGVVTTLSLTACNIDNTTTLPTPSADFSQIIEYTPAPGQFINSTNHAGFNGQATPEAAADYATRRLRNREYVSLGSWGGYITAEFDSPVINDGGYNLLIEGNQITTSSEPGIVWVMCDKNQNGQPDEIWYELCGSEEANAIHQYEVTYYRSAAAGAPVAWSDNLGATGSIERTNEHTQDYYPAWITAESYTLRGTRLPDNIGQSGYLWVAHAFEWGYADNMSREGRNLFRISDAVDADGMPVSLTEIHFVKIQSGVLAQAPAIGEVSTEICSIRNYNLLK